VFTTKRLALVTLVLASAATAGCMGSSPFTRVSGRASDPLAAGHTISPPANAPQSTKSSPSTPSKDRSVITSPALHSTTGSPKSGESWTDSISTGFSKAATSVSNAFTIKPKVIPADDPTTLASRPGAVGPDVYVSAARLAETHNNAAHAEEQYRKALAADPRHRAALVGYARLLHRQEKLAESVAVYKTALAAYPRDPLILNDLGMCYARQGQPQTSIDMLNKAVELAPSSKLYRNNIATVLVASHRHEEAYAHLVQVHGEAAAHYNLGHLLHQSGNDRLAGEHFARALAADPTLVQARTMLERVGGGPALQPGDPRVPDLGHPATVDHRGPRAMPASDPLAGSRGPSRVVGEPKGGAASAVMRLPAHDAYDLGGDASAPAPAPSPDTWSRSWSPGNEWPRYLPPVTDGP
jgi:tetratricopeptide (TPR) repeat protein